MPVRFDCPRLWKRLIALIALSAQARLMDCPTHHRPSRMADRQCRHEETSQKDKKMQTSRRQCVSVRARATTELLSRGCHILLYTAILLFTMICDATPSRDTVKRGERQHVSPTSLGTADQVNCDLHGRAALTSSALHTDGHSHARGYA